MPYIRIPVQRKHTFLPSEAGEIGGAWRSLAGQVRTVGSVLHGLGGQLDVSWEGNSKQAFMVDYGPVLGTTESSVDLLESLAGEVARICVTEWETEWEEVWSAG